MITLVWGINVIKVFKKFLGWGVRSVGGSGLAMQHQNDFAG